MGIRNWITARIARFLNRNLSHYEQRGRNDFEGLKSCIHKGDVLLVEGDQRISAVIKYLTQSSWSHAALYVGDEIVRRGGQMAELAHQHFGDEARHLVVEALFEGVVVSPLTRYVDYNVRLCRPHRLRPAHLKIILDEAVAAIGWHYDVRNVLDQALHLLMVSLMPGRYRSKAQRLGSGAATEVICTSLLGQLFAKVGFPVLPSVIFPDGVESSFALPRGSLLARLRRQPVYKGVFHQRHPTLLSPCDFDLSPYFGIVKFNVIEHGGFDYQRIEWAREPLADEVA
ncbi:MAG: YiiX/YebB-like N1pC/P60 family cysteine hydrolase [Myxococcota bacterium]